MSFTYTSHQYSQKEIFAYLTRISHRSPPINIAILKTQGADPSVRQNKKLRSDYQGKNEKGRNQRRTYCKEGRG